MFQIGLQGEVLINFILQACQPRNSFGKEKDNDHDRDPHSKDLLSSSGGATEPSQPDLSPLVGIIGGRGWYRKLSTFAHVRQAQRCVRCMF